MPKKVFRSLDLYSKEHCDYRLIGNSSTGSDFEGPPFSVMGAGRSITGAFFGKDTRVLQLESHNPRISLDQLKHQVRVCASATIGEVYNELIKNGFFLTALPSYPGVTVGGCIAANVHGQNHYCEGCFGENVLSLSIMHPEFGLKTASPTTNRNLFDLTIGGFGLSGVITEVTLRVVPLQTDMLQVSLQQFHSLAQSYELMMNEKEKYDYFHGWADLTNLSRHGERGFLLCAQFMKGEKFSEAKEISEGLRTSHLRWKPRIFTGSLLKWINEFYFRSNTYRPHTERVLADFIFPSKNRLWYFSMFGQLGIIEHQVLIPHASVRPYIAELKATLLEKKPFVSLCHMKLFKGQRKLLNFDGDGFCLAMHFRSDRTSLDTLVRLDEINVNYGCITNIIKDSRVPASVLRRQYSEYDEFLERIVQYDPHRTFQNTISQKIFSEGNV